MKGKPEASLISVVMQFGESILNNCHSEPGFTGEESASSCQTADSSRDETTRRNDNLSMF